MELSGSVKGLFIFARSLKEQGLEDYIIDSTGLLVDPYFSGTKVAWILDQAEGIRELAEKGKLSFSTVDSWLLYKLSGDSIYLTDYTNASRTILFNIKFLKWDDKILEALNIPASLLPSVREFSGKFGEVDLFGEKVLLLLWLETSKVLYSVRAILRQEIVR